LTQDRRDAHCASVQTKQKSTDGQWPPLQSNDIKAKAIQLGYESCGIIPAAEFCEYKNALDGRIASFPNSAGMYKKMYSLADPPKDAKSIIVCARSYTRYKIPEKLKGKIAKFYLFDGRLDFTREYRARTEFVEFLTSNGINIIPGGIPQRLAAVKAGLGFLGRNNFLYTDSGSYVYIDTWLTDAELEYDGTPQYTQKCLCNDNCRRCIDACPTGALSGDFSMDRGKCIPALCVSASNPNYEELQGKMGTWIYGCDVCQDICPMNAGKMKETENFPRLPETAEYFTPEAVAEMDEETFLNVVQPRFWYIDKDGLWIWKRNARRAMENRRR